MRNPGTLFAATLVGAAIIGIVGSLATGNWLFLLAAIAVEVVGTGAVLAYGALTSRPATAESDAAELARREQERLAELRRRGERITGTRTPRS